MAESTALKRQNLEGGGSEPPSSAEKKQKYAEGNVSVTPSSAAAEEKSKNGSDPPPSSAEDSELPPSSSPEKKIEKLTASVNYWSLTPYDEGYAEHFYREVEGNGDIDEILPEGAKKEQRPEFVKVWVNHDRQMHDSDGFDCYDFPGGVMGSIQPFTYPTTRQIELMMELSKLAIQEYNEKECNVFKYKVLKIEKANFQLTSYSQYYMTVKVLNLTLGSVIETFRILAAEGLDDDDDFREVFSCQPKVKVAPDIVHHN